MKKRTTSLMDSVEKTVTRHFATLAREPFTYNGVEYQPKVLLVSPLLLRGVECVPNCGACCRRFTLDWLPSEYALLKEHGYDKRVELRTIEFNGKHIPIYSDLQDDHKDYFCRNLRREDGRCGIHLFHPHSCDFELIRTLQSNSPDNPNRLTQKLFGRGWAMTRVTDGQKGAMCYMKPVTKETIASVIRRLNRFTDWADHFGLKTWAPLIVKLIERNQLDHQIELDPDNSPKGFGL